MEYLSKEHEKRQHRVSFTGHRPWKQAVSEAVIRAAVFDAISQSINDGYCTFISGMAQGLDIIAAETVLEFREHNQNIRLICALPYPGFEYSWPLVWKERLSSVLKCADLVRVISPSYSPRSYQMRNEWMVNHSNLVIAFYQGVPGGTKNTIDYAKNKGVMVKILDITE